MSRIRVLSETLINKIAAGEVVERPASVVKELLENAIDAEAQNVIVEITDGGTKRIKVTDDGIGMTAEEAEIALRRHATSKLSSVDDLFAIATMGFRGEALPSIASVSLFTLTTRNRGEAGGTRIQVDGGEIRSNSPHGAPEGTSIEVRELFFNLPARKKFLKTVTTETRQIIQMATAISLANPEVGFKLMDDDRVIFDLVPVKSLAERVRDVYGGNLFDRMISFEQDAGPIRVAGFVTPPSDAKRHRMEMRFFVNRRPITSRVIHAAVMAGYGDLLPKGNYPQGAIYLDVNPDLVDVNVSPTKNEVRFKDERTIYHILYHAVSDALSSPEVIPEGAGDESESESEEYTARTRAAIADFVRSHREEDADLAQHRFLLETKPSINAPERGFNLDTPPRMETVPETEIELGRAEHAAQRSFPTETSGAVQPYHIVGFADLYLVAFSKDALYIVDQHAAHERILYEKALASFERESLVSQKLLFPVNVELEPSLYSIATGMTADLGSLGFEVEPFGARSVAIYAAPSVIKGNNPERVLRNILDDLEGIDLQSENIHKKMAQVFACRAAIKAGDRITEGEMGGIVVDLFKCGNPYVCPHGRPTLIKLSKSELEKRFGR